MGNKKTHMSNKGRSKKWTRGEHYKQRVFHLLLRCPECGRVFYRRRDSVEIRCDEEGKPLQFVSCGGCGKEVQVPPAEKLRGVRMICKCGCKSRYLTNIADPWMERPCRECGAPMYAAFNPGRNCYYTEDE